MMRNVVCVSTICALITDHRGTALGWEESSPFAQDDYDIQNTLLIAVALMP